MALTTEVYLCKNTRLLPGSEDTYYFASEASRQSFFTGKSTADLHITAMSYQREDSVMRVPLPLEDVEVCDYMMFRNNSSNLKYSDKWYYAFIKKCTYINDEVTEITFEIDPMQTWFPSLTVQAQNIERETTATDNVTDVNYKQDEGLPTGELFPYTRSTVDSNQAAKKYLCFAMKRMYFTATFTCYAGDIPKVAYLQKATAFYAASQDAMEGTVVTAPVGLGNSDWLASTYFYVLIPLHGSAESRLAGFMQLFGGNVQDGNNAILLDVDDVAAVFNCPLSVLKDSLQTLAAAHPYAPVILGPDDGFRYSPSGTGQNATYDTTRDVIIGCSNGATASIYVNQPSSATGLFDGYTPVNKRCLQSPFVEFRFQDGNGGSSEDLHPERFWDNDDSVHRIAAIAKTYLNSTKVNRFIQIKYYDGRPVQDMTFELPETLQYSFSYDTISSWQALNGSYMQSQQQLNVLSNLIAGATSLASGNAQGLIAAGMGEASRDLNYKHALAVGKTGTPSTHGSAGGNVIMTNQNTDVGYMVGYCAHRNFVEAADKYFTKYGYKTNRQGSISFTARPRFTYFKTNGFNCYGNVPAAAKDAIVKRFEQGVRMWRGDYIGDYSTSNAPV